MGLLDSLLQESVVKMDLSKMSALFPKPVMAESSMQEKIPSRHLAAAAKEEYSCEFGSTKYFALCAFGGVLSCGITHTAVTPLDLVKCRLQVDKEKYKSLGNGFKVTIAEGGAAGLFLGWAPTAIGYSAQGLGPRIIMIGTLTALQWFIYDGVKVQLGLPRPPPPEMPESLKSKMGLAQQ